MVSKIHIYTQEEVEKMTIGMISDDTQSCLEEAPTIMAVSKSSSVGQPDSPPTLVRMWGLFKYYVCCISKCNFSTRKPRSYFVRWCSWWNIIMLKMLCQTWVLPMICNGVITSNESNLACGRVYIYTRSINFKTMSKKILLLVGFISDIIQFIIIRKKTYLSGGMKCWVLEMNGTWKLNNFRLSWKCMIG